MCTFDRLSTTKDAVVDRNGRLTVTANLTRAGIFEYLASEIKPQWPTCDAVQAYPDNAILRAYRSLDEISKDDYLESAKYSPITDNHPPDMMHPETTDGFTVGVSTENVSMVDGHPQAKLVLWSARAIDAYKKGKKEISIGAYNDFVWGPSKTADGEPYDFQIVNSVVNHIALVDKGRAGPTARILDEAPKQKPKKKGNIMKIEINGATFDIDDNAAKLFEAERTEFRATIDRLNGEVEVLKKREISEDELGKLVDAELKKREVAAEMDRKRQAVKDAGFDVENKSDDRILGMFEMLPAAKDGEASGHTADNAGVGFGGERKKEAVTRDDVMRAKNGIYRN